MNTATMSPSSLPSGLRAVRVRSLYRTLRTKLRLSAKEAYGFAKYATANHAQ